MKKYIRAYKLFLGELPCKQALYSLVIVAILCVMFCVEYILGGGSDFVMGLFHGIAAMIGPIAALWGTSLLIALYNTCSPETPGYKFFRCIPDGRMRRSARYTHNAHCNGIRQFRGIHQAQYSKNGAYDSDNDHSGLYFRIHGGTVRGRGTHTGGHGCE